MCDYGLNWSIPVISAHVWLQSLTFCLQVDGDSLRPLGECCGHRLSGVSSSGVHTHHAPIHPWVGRLSWEELQRVLSLCCFLHRPATSSAEVIPPAHNAIRGHLGHLHLNKYQDAPGGVRLETPENISHLPVDGWEEHIRTSFTFWLKLWSKNVWSENVNRITRLPRLLRPRLNRCLWIPFSSTEPAGLSWLQAAAPKSHRSGWEGNRSAE